MKNASPDKTYFVLGVMSGTSLDGIDLAYVQLSWDKGWRYAFIAAETVAYPKKWQQQLGGAIALSKSALSDLDVAYTAYLSSIIKQFIDRKNISQLDAICSHGHTILHDPGRGITYQIGNRPELAALLNCRVICDFRVQDVALGGQGAPLVPIGDRLLFGTYDFCLNLGGFANISFEKANERIAFDICPVNIVLNALAEKLGVPYDKDGMIAATHPVNDDLLKKLNALPFYEKLPPKSLGLEWVKENVWPVLESEALSPEIKMATFTEHAAQQIAEAVSAHKDEKPQSLLATGGGAYNQHLIERLQSYVEVEIKVPEENLIEFKEALIFAFMGVLKLRDQVNVLRSVTGAARDHSTGIVRNP